MLFAFVSCTIAEDLFAFVGAQARYTLGRVVVATVLFEDGCIAVVAHGAAVHMVAAAGALEVVASFSPSSHQCMNSPVIVVLRIERV